MSFNFKLHRVEFGYSNLGSNYEPDPTTMARIANFYKRNGLTISTSPAVLTLAEKILLRPFTTHYSLNLTRDSNLDTDTQFALKTIMNTIYDNLSVSITSMSTSDPINYPVPPMSEVIQPTISSDTDVGDLIIMVSNTYKIHNLNIQVHASKSNTTIIGSGVYIFDSGSGSSK